MIEDLAIKDGPGSDSYQQLLREKGEEEVEKRRRFLNSECA